MFVIMENAYKLTLRHLLLSTNLLGTKVKYFMKYAEMQKL